MNEINFSQIRNHEGSQAGGFEELICQLAHLTTPEKADYFVRKSGAGGDAGVECYWKLNTGDEHAWQTKYFIDKFGDTQWQEIDESVISALEKHENLTEYYVCLPFDWSDSRKRGKTGKKVTTAWDKWVAHVKKWEQFAKARNKTVVFKYWCRHEISLMLHKDDPNFSGRALYWFGVPVLKNDYFKHLALKSQNTLGDRYTPEYHTDLPISKVLEALGKSPYWLEEVEKDINDWLTSLSKSEASIQHALDLLQDNDSNIKSNIDKISHAMKLSISNDSFFNKIVDISKNLEIINDELIQLHTKLQTNASSENPDTKKLINGIINFNSSTYSLMETLDSNSYRAAQMRSLLLIGEAGIGKSHLLCDIALSRIKENLPTVFILGQHYTGGNPISYLKNSLDLSNISDKDFLAILDSAGEAKRTNTLIMIDAINEGNSREDWPLNIDNLLFEIRKYPHLSIVFSCRTTYVEWLVPENVIKQHLLKVTHYGFRGYEHRAASNYLNKQGIHKPSAPIISPEFTNPLFLKTCCKALKEQGHTSFPKGLNGITLLLNFYTKSIDSTITKMKRYRAGENIISKALEAFSLKLYPDSQFGIEVTEAEALINGFDTKPNRSNSLFELLLDEGVLSEDLQVEQSPTGIKYHNIIRFTYERFSDYFIALSLFAKLRDKDIKKELNSSEIFAPLIKKKSSYKYTGVLSALGIIISENNQLEIIDIIPEELTKDNWIFNHLFTDTIPWRNPSSFTSRTRELLNTIPEHGFFSKRLEILLGLSSEPNHPWNADFIHERLISKAMPERDRFWSTHITISDSNEEDNSEESILRALIEWGYSGTLIEVEIERVRLCSTILIWMTSSTNRKVRDQATKSAVRLLSNFPSLIIQILTNFSEVDDLYVKERLYAITYGALTNSDDIAALTDVSKWIWEKEFYNNKPTPHILLRDYARGILEYANVKNSLDSSIKPENFRPPYDSSWPLDIPTVTEIETLYGDKHETAIQNSIMGFPGDFGNYTMGCIHHWSPTSINEKKPQTVYELQLQFAQNHLSGDLKERFITYIDGRNTADRIPINIKDLKIEFVDPSEAKEDKPTEFDLINDEFQKIATPEQKEFFRWVMGLGRPNSIAAFSRKAAQRWVCKKAFDLGWSKENFESFEKTYINYSSRHQSLLERIGKKYQWIALHIFLAHLSDNCCYIDRGYSDVDYSKYYGPWEIHQRDIDPTLTIRSTNDNGWRKWDKSYWWQPFIFPFTGSSIEELETWLWDESVVPDFKNLLQVHDKNNKSWFVLHSFASWKKEPKENKNEIPYQDAWYRINSCVIKKSDYKKLARAVKGKTLRDPHILSYYSSSHQGFFREFPWHPIHQDLISWSKNLGYSFDDYSIQHLVPISRYEWETGNNDYSNDNSISIYLPENILINDLKLKPSLSNPGIWYQNLEDNIVFFDPCVFEDGPSSALFDSDTFLKWLDSNGYQIVWLVGGEKQLITSWSSKFFGRLVYSGLFTYTSNEIKGNLWFMREEPRD